MPYEDEDWGESVKDQMHDLKEQGPLAGVYKGYEVVQNDLGESRLHKFDCNGLPTKVWGKTHLNRLLEGREGELVKVAMTGEEIALGGGRKMIEYELWSKGRQNAAPLPPTQPLPSPSNGGDAVPFEQGAEGPHGDAEARQVRARRVAIACKDAGMDDEMRGDFIAYYTFDDTRSAHDLDEKQAEEVWKLAQKIRRGKTDIRYDENGKMFLEEGGKRVNS